MNFNKKDDRRMAIMNDEKGLYLAESLRGARNGGRKGIGKGGPGLKLSKAQHVRVPKDKLAQEGARGKESKFAPTVGGIGAPKATVTAKDKPSHYVDGELRIPLYYDSKQTKKRQVRNCSALGKSKSKPWLLGEVRKYGAESKAREFEAKNATNSEIARWIEEMETKAFGANGDRKKCAQNVKTVEDSGREIPVEQSDVRISKLPPTTKSAQPPAHEKLGQVRFKDGTMNEGKRKRDDEETIAPLVQTTKKTKLGGRFTATQKSNSNKAHPPAQHNHQLSTKIKFCMEDKSHKTQATVPKKHTTLLTPYEKAAVDAIALYSAKIHNKHTISRYPFIDYFDLDPKSDPSKPSSTSATKVLNIPLKRCKAIMTAVSEATVHVTEIPYEDLKGHPISAPKVVNRSGFYARHGTGKANAASQQPATSPAPYLKPGKHGWDYEIHRWGFEGDSDLPTGIGHQVQPADAERLEREGEAFRKEFDGKYPGKMGNQWPCGCQLPWNDDDDASEAE